MKYLVLAYGSEEDWLALSEREREACLAQDAVLRARGDLVAALDGPTTVRAPEGTVVTLHARFAASDRPMVGFGLIEADDLEHAVRLVQDTPCVCAKGAVELWPVRDLGENTVEAVDASFTAPAPVASLATSAQSPQQ